MIRHIALTVGAGAVVAGLSMAALLRLNGGMPWPVVVLASVLLASLCTAGVMIHLVRRYMPGIQAVRQGLERLDDGTWERLPDCGADDWRVMISALNRAAGRIRDQIRSLRTLGEIDRVLLGAADLEQALDAILGRVRRVTACRTAGIVLRDPDAPSHGRVFLAADAQHGLPLSRVSLDECMMATLAAEPQGLTVTRCEEVRHSFLRPLRNHGAEFFWLWPVMLDNQLRAVFTIGYREPPSAGPQIARAGSELVSRLAAVLARVSREEHLYRQAHYDPLTGLPNRLLFASTLSPEIAGAVPGLVRGAVLYVDLDHFKRVNDTAGHAAGDQLLRIAAQRLRSCVKETDTVARLGGDEFAVILRDVASRRDASAVGERIVVSLQQPVRAGGRDHQISASIGLALFPEDGRAIDEVLQNADKAMYRAKEEGRGCVLSYDSGMGSPQVETTGSGLQEALHQREFSLFYQPQYAARDGALTGLEALLRWQTQRQGMRGPDDFVPAAEESGLIVDIGGWVLETACAQLADWRSQGLRPPTLSLNVSAQQLRHPEFVRSVRKALARFELPADQLELDIEEPVLASAANADIIHALAALGVRLALDGFSTGYASLSYLRQYPLSSVKLDRAFLTHVPGDAAAAQLVETVIVVAHKLGKRVVAEGIETVEQLDFLRERGCDSVQGFYLARPLQAAETSELLVSHARRSMPEVRVVTL